MWENPIYKFKTEVNGKKKQIFIDVTGSALTFSKPGKQLEGTFDELLEGLEPTKTKILDFGAGKLRNTIYLLEQGYTVYSCEFKDLFSRSKQAHKLYDRAKKFESFRELVFPKEFIESEEQFDVILLIDVLSIMPVPIERFCVLLLCRERIRKGGRLLWYTQRRVHSYDDAVAKLCDGVVTGKRRQFNMFYRVFTVKEIHEMLASVGFSHNRNFKLYASGSNQAYVYNPDRPILIDKTLKITELLKRGVKRKRIERKSRVKKIIYETKIPTRISRVKEIKLLEMYSKELDKIVPGRRDALKYQWLIFRVLTNVFDNRLKRPEMEAPLAGKTKRVDIAFKNPCTYTEGFFRELALGYRLICPNIYIECKNYSYDVSNPEFAQIQADLNRVRGQFGFLTCRSIQNWENTKIKQNHMVRDKKYVIVLVDSDIKNLIRWKLEDDEEEIDFYLEEKFKELID